ncbi:hypothetical protein [Polymorphospora sp. NPDC050346]|uniref:hypothetical protein n=1 Tax=Polymorphospora sp. NPDC050346 TaxID=3155780 RepID=UPI0033D54707
MRFVRFQSPEADALGRYVGVFGLVNTLARQGRLTPDQERFRRANNDWYEAAYPDPSTVVPGVYDHDRNPGAAAWFKISATTLIERVAGYLDILAAHEVKCIQLAATDPPGRVIYEDEFQILIVPDPTAAASRPTTD